MEYLGVIYDACERCFRPLADGDHGLGLCPLEPRSRATAIHADSIVGGLTIENGFKTPQTFYSKSEMDRAFAEHGLTRKERFAPTPGTDIDPAGVQNPEGYVDAVTLANRAEMLLRSTPRDPDAVDIGTLLRNQKIIVDGGKDAEKLVAGDARRSARVGRRLNGEGARTGEESVDAGRGDSHPRKGRRPAHP